jgi:hypothetical protein
MVTPPVTIAVFFQYIIATVVTYSNQLQYVILLAPIVMSFLCFCLVLVVFWLAFCNLLGKTRSLWVVNRMYVFFPIWVNMMDNVIVGMVTPPVTIAVFFQYIIATVVIGLLSVTF